MNIETIKLNLAGLNSSRAPAPGIATRVDGTATVSNLVFEAVAETCASHRARLVAPSRAGSLAPEWLLRILTYSYAKGVMASEDIERKLLAGSVSPENVPDAGTLRRFRRLNRAALEAALEKVLVLIRLRRVRGAQTVPASRPAIGAETAMILHHEATARIEEAVLLDHAAAGE